MCGTLTQLSTVRLARPATAFPVDLRAYD